MPRLHLTVHGRVQGVSFRWHAHRRARGLGLTGWVRNRPDGTVEAEAQGEAQALHSFATWVEQGPSGARVERVESDPLPERPDEVAFRILE